MILNAKSSSIILVLICIYIIIKILKYYKLILNNYIIKKYLKFTIYLKILLRVQFMNVCVCRRSKSKWIYLLEQKIIASNVISKFYIIISLLILRILEDLCQDNIFLVIYIYINPFTLIFLLKTLTKNNAKRPNKRITNSNKKNKYRKSQLKIALKIPDKNNSKKFRQKTQTKNNYKKKNLRKNN